jgi:hypothetical protein
MNDRKQFFTPEEVEALFDGTARQGIGIDPVVELNLIADRCVRISHEKAAPTAGERQKMFRFVRAHATKLVAAFGLTRPHDHLDSDRTAEAIYALLQSIPSNASLYLRHSMAQEIKASELPGEWEVFRATLRGLQLMMLGGQLGDDAAELGKGAPRTSPREEIYLISALRDLYQKMTGDDDWDKGPPDEPPSGPLASFIRAVAAHIRDELAAVEPVTGLPAHEPVPPGLAANLNALSIRSWRIGSRFREVRRIIRNRTAS